MDWMNLRYVWITRKEEGKQLQKQTMVDYTPCPKLTCIAALQSDLHATVTFQLIFNLKAKYFTTIGDFCRVLRFLGTHVT